ncbi:hypothetical protein LXL04_027557 [Taraxacum kok-saghyz]
MDVVNGGCDVEMAPTSAAEPSSATKESPNWLDMPDELMVNIFQRLPSVEVLKSTRKVCTTWGRICKYPAMWKVINLHKRQVDDWCSYFGLEALTKEAVDLSRGELIDISIEGFGTDDLLDHIVLHSNKLKRLSLASCYCITDNALSMSVKSLPQLEELHLLDTSIDEQNLEVIGRNCPQLKSFKMSKMCTWTCNDRALAIANNMPELRHLELSDPNMTNDGVEAILNGCRHLQSLYLHDCDNLELNGYLKKKCREKIKDFKYNNPTPNYEYYDDEEFFEEDMYVDFYESDFYED